MRKQVPIFLLIAVIFAGAGFFGGMKYQQSKRSAFLQQFSGVQNQRATVNRMGLRPVNGEIISSDEKSITVKLQDGSSKIVLFSEKTTVNKAAEATKEDLKNGEKVMVVGTENSDGSVTAQNIQLNPILRGQLPTITP